MASNYRPISRACTPNKVIKLSIDIHCFNYLQVNNIIRDDQFETFLHDFSVG